MLMMMPMRKSRLSLISALCALGLHAPTLLGAQEPAEGKSRLLAPYVTATLGFATGPGDCPAETPCFPSAPMAFALSGGARVRIASLGARGAGVWASLGPEYARIPLFLSDLPTPTAWLAAGRITVGARARAAVAGSTGTFEYGITRGRIVQWGVHAQYENALVFAGVTQLRAMHLYQITPTEVPRPFRPRLVVFGTGFDF